MTRHVVVGTAGHVDHGKTALVKTLTGTDTDRWEEEKRRGITIDLGFARLDLGSGITASIVDVPGHEDFVRNMVAGATGVDVALLVVGADEGVMPQTVEHVAILDLLGVRAGVVAITKTDLAEPDWLELAVADVTERIQASSVRWEPPVFFSAVTGRGSEELRAALSRASERATVRSEHDLFRMPVDRVFSAPGAGTVVTGTTWSGTVASGDTVRVLPGSVRARVRSVEVHGEARPQAEPGRRTALALPGTEKADITRGCVVVASETWRESLAIDVMLTLLTGARAITQRTRVRFHLGTAEIMARVTPAVGDIAPGSTGAARLRLEHPVVARWGDRGVLRSYSPMSTIGGCVIGDPFPPRKPRRPVDLEQRLDVDRARRLLAFVELGGWNGLPLDDVAVRTGVHVRDVPEVVEQARALGVRIVGERLVAGTVLDHARDVTLEAIGTYHGAHPLEPGMPRELARAVLRRPEYADVVHTGLAEQGIVQVERETLRLTEFRPELSARHSEWATAMRQILEEAGPRGATEPELAAGVGVERVRDVAEFMVRQGEAARVGQDRYFDAVALGQLQTQILDFIAEHGRATPAQLRDITGLTRKYLIPVLEWMDGSGFTIRDGDSRRAGPAGARGVKHT